MNTTDLVMICIFIGAGIIYTFLVLGNSRLYKKTYKLFEEKREALIKELDADLPRIQAIKKEVDILFEERKRLAINFTQCFDEQLLTFKLKLEAKTEEIYLHRENNIEFIRNFIDKIVDLKYIPKIIEQNSEKRIEEFENLNDLAEQNYIIHLPNYNRE